VRGRDDRDGEAGLEVRLLEVRVHGAGIGRLELGVGVHALIRRVDAAVQSGAVVGVPAVGEHGELVVDGQASHARPEDLLPGGQVKLDVVRFDLQQPGPLSRLGPGDLGNRHSGSPVHRLSR
jgi:hypothetical protein